MSSNLAGFPFFHTILHYQFSYFPVTGFGGTGTGGTASSGSFGSTFTCG
jgi:hypothetical protein